MKLPLDVLRLYPQHDYTLRQAFATRAARDPNRLFMRYENRTWTWAQFDEAVARLASAFAERGVKKGERVAVLARNSDSHVLALFALARLGATMVPTNPEFGVEEARYVLTHAEPVGVIASAETMATVRSACDRMEGQPWFLSTDEQSDAPSLLSLLETDARALPTEGAADDPCLIIYTSGTTGFPKGVMHSQRNFITAGETFIQRVHLQDDDRIMIVLPLFHINALFYSLAGTLAAGASCVVIPRFSASRFWSIAVEMGATQTNIIEAMGTILQSRPREEFRTEHGIRAMYGSRPSFAGTFQNDFHVRDMVSGFGMSEIPGVTCTEIGGQQKPGSMGRVGRHPDPERAWAECRIVDDDGRDVAPNEVGEMWVKTPIVMLGYFRDPEQTNAAFQDGWFKTGDLVRRDEDGFFFFVSRKKDIIRRRGENIAGAELDRVIGSHPGVFEVAAIAVPAELGEDEILAAIVKRPGHDVSAADIAQWCRERLAAMKVPRYVLFVDHLPHTATHKIAKQALRQDTTLKARATDITKL